jgi:hypothetical protein
MRWMIHGLLMVVLLLGSPLAHAVTCVMANTQTPEELAGMPADCPMFAAALAANAAKVPQLSVADCVKAPALSQAEVSAPAVKHHAAAPLPVAMAPLPARPLMREALVRPPPDYGLARLSSKTVLLATARLRP